MLFLRRLISGVVIPGWAGPLAAVAIAFALYFYIDTSARNQERAIVTAEATLEQHAKDVAAQKHFAENAAETAAAIAVLAKQHAAEVEQRDERRDQLAAAWDVVTVQYEDKPRSKAPKAKAGAAECWPVAVVMELRK